MKTVARGAIDAHDGWVNALSRAAAVFSLMALLIVAPVATASVTQEEQAGSRVLRELETGALHCADLKGSDFDHLGEYAMGQVTRSRRAHEAMNDLMSRMMGEGERQMHEAMGRRLAGCAAGKLPVGFGRMMGTINAMGMMGAGMMGGAGARGLNDPRGMMGGGGFGPGMMGSSSSSDEDGSEGPPAGAAVGMLAALIAIAALALALLAWRGRANSAPESPAEILKRRYARGELSTEDYRARLDAIR